MITSGASKYQPRKLTCVCWEFSTAKYAITAETTMAAISANFKIDLLNFH